MTISALERLKHRSEQLETLLMKGSNVQIIAARELFRLSLVELYEQGFWQANPAEFQIHMRLYRASGPFRFSAPASMSGPDRMVRYTL